jgi:hypothetical protein
MDLPRLAWLFSCVGIAVCDAYLACLWIFAAVRTRLVCFIILAGTSLLWFVFSVLAALLSFAPSIIRFVDPAFYRLFRIWFFAVQPLVLCIGLVGNTMLVRHLLRPEPHAPANV